MAGKRCIIKNGRIAPGLAMAGLLFLALLIILCLRPGLPDAAGEKLEQASRGLTAYQTTLRLDDEAHTLAISQQAGFRNDTENDLEQIVVRLWLNAYENEESSPAALEEIYDSCYPDGFSSGFMTLYDVMWNGARAEYAWLDAAKTALSISIPALKPGETGELFIRCVANIPHCAHRIGYTESGYQLGNLLPVIAMPDENGWDTREYSPIGDPFVSAAANYDLTVYLPEGYIPACSAPLEQGKDGAWRGKILCARDIALCASRDYILVKEQKGNTAVYSYGPSQASARRALQYAGQALDTFSALYGAYPWPALTVCSVDFPFGGMEYSGLCMIGENYYQEAMADSMELVIAHETAHQWFYSLVGSDQFHHPWQDEGICEYATLRYVQKRYGQGSYETLKFFRVDAPMQENIPGSLTPGSPIDYFPSYTDYSAVVYGRGAAFFLALDEMLEKGADDFLRSYADEFSFDFASRQEFELFLNQYAGMDLTPLVVDYLDTAH
ncbi:MAG: M1 family metallopeptidase [Clostridiales bacterium]|nr:M1 family metallopeptidase [Clostridiales bacterium]